MYPHIYTYKYYLYIHIWGYIYIFIHIYIYIYCIYGCIYPCVGLYISRSIDLEMWLYRDMFYVCVCVYVCLCVFVCLHTCVSKTLDLSLYHHCAVVLNRSFCSFTIVLQRRPRLCLFLVFFRGVTSDKRKGLMACRTWYSPAARL